MTDIVTLTSRAESIQGIHITNRDDMVAAFTAANDLGYGGDVSYDPNGQQYRLRLNSPTQGDEYAYIGDWVVLDTTGRVVTMTNAIAAQRYSAAVGITWEALTVPPVATALPGRKARINLPAPVGVDGPFTYAVKQTVDGATTAATVESADTSGPLTAVLGSLTEGKTYTFTVVATDSFSHTATSLPSNTITAAQ